MSSTPTVESVIAAAARHRHEGFALVAFDAPIGVPPSYLAAARTSFGLSETATFIEWLPMALAKPDFLKPRRAIRSLGS